MISRDNQNRRLPSINLMDGIFLIFLALKLSGKIDWPWLWVMSPLWIPLSVLILVAIMIGVSDRIKMKRAARRIASNLMNNSKV
jgi:hypothetical protein